MKTDLWTARTLIVGLVLAAAIGCGDAVDPEDARFEKALATLASAGSEAAVAELFKENEPVDATRTVLRLVHHLYGEENDLHRSLAVGRNGLAAATLASKGAPDVRLLVFEISSCLADYTWPGWGREGIRVRKADREVGLKAARHALELARELELPPERLARAYWLVGAHRMLEGGGDATIAAFDEARRHGSEKFNHFVNGTMLIARVRSGLALREAKKAIRGELQALLDLGSEEADRYAEQLETAWRILGPRAGGRGSTVTVTAGPVTLEVASSRAARHFAVLSKLARGLLPADPLSLSKGDRQRLDRAASLLGRSPNLRRHFFTKEAPTAALFEAAGTGLLTPAEVTDLSGTFSALATRIEAYLADRRLDGEAFAAALDVQRIEEVAKRASKFTAVKSLVVEVWPVPAEPGKPRGRFEDGRIVLEVEPGADPTADLVYGIASAFLMEREKDLRPALMRVESQAGAELPLLIYVEAIAALLVEGDEAADARNVRGPTLLHAMRLTMEVDGWSLDYEALDPLAAFLREVLAPPDTTAGPK